MATALRSIASLPVIVSSVTPIAETSEVSLTRTMSWFPIGPRIRSTACGRMTWRKALNRPMPIERAASHWRWLTDSIAPRYISVRNAAVLHGDAYDAARELRRIEAKQRKPEIDEVDLQQQRRVAHQLDEGDRR